MRLNLFMTSFLFILGIGHGTSHAQDTAPPQTVDALPPDAQNAATPPQVLPQNTDDELENQNEPRVQRPGSQQDPNSVQGQSQRLMQGQANPNRVPQNQRVIQGQQNPNQVQDPNQPDPQRGQRWIQGQQVPALPPNQQNPTSLQGQQDPNQIQGQDGRGQRVIQGQQDPNQPQGQTQPGVQDPTPADPSQVRPLPKKPRVLPSPTPTPPPAPAFTPAPTPIPEEPAPRPAPSGPKTTEQSAYEAEMQNRWNAAADEITQLQSRGESLKGRKGKAFRESLRTASGNRSMARTKLKQLVAAPSADFDKHKKGVERAFTDLDTSIAKVRSYFDKSPSP